MTRIKICLDAGHAGKYNQSPVIKTYYESDMNWKLHLLLKAELESYGFEVITTRPNQATDLDVYSRGTAAQGCTLFASIHSNACDTESVDYPVVYRAYDNKGNVDALALPLAKKIAEVMGTRQAGRTATRQNSSGGEYYGVLRGARAVGLSHYLIIEHSFHTNTAATQWLLNDNNLVKLAKAEAEIIAKFYGMSKTETGTDGLTAIMGEAKATAAQMTAFALQGNPSPKLPSCTVEQLANIFLEESKVEGVRADVAWAQSLKETGYFQYGGIVTPDMNNYGGIGALNNNKTGDAARFDSPRLGVRAQIQHLKAYASKASLANECIDPRFHLVTRGSAEFVEWLGAADNPNGKGWAYPGKGYGANIVTILKGILSTKTKNNTQPTPSPAPSKSFTAGDKVKVKNAIQYDGKPFRTYYDVYDVISANGDRVVIGIGSTITAAVNAANLEMYAARPIITEGGKVKVKNAVQYNGQPFKVYYTEYDVIDINGDRVVIGIGKTVTAAVKADNLIAV